MGSRAVSHRLRIPTEVAELIRGLHPGIKRKVRAALQAIVEAPGCGKPLKEDLAGLRSYRMGRMRTVYRVADDRLVEVVAVGPRKQIYEETYRRVQRENR
jgi:mRNA interferase RelE/StbE